MNFVDLVMDDKEDMSKLAEYMDKWDISSGIPIYKFLGFKENQWLIIVQEPLAYKYIMQDIAVERKILPIDEESYSKLLKFITPTPEMLMFGKAKLFMERELCKLYDMGCIDFVPTHLFVSYNGYAGFKSHRFFIDLVDIANMKFNWSKLENDDENAATGTVTEQSVPRDESSERIERKMDGSGSEQSGVGNKEM